MTIIFYFSEERELERVCKGEIKYVFMILLFLLKYSMSRFGLFKYFVDYYSN